MLVSAVQQALSFHGAHWEHSKGRVGRGLRPLARGADRMLGMQQHHRPPVLHGGTAPASDHCQGHGQGPGTEGQGCYFAECLEIFKSTKCHEVGKLQTGAGGAAAELLYGVIRASRSTPIVIPSGGTLGKWGWGKKAQRGDQLNLSK